MHVHLVMRPERYNRGGMVNWRMREGIHTCACSIPALLATHVRTGGECMQVQWGSEHSSKITQHHTVKVYGDWELQSTVGVQTVLSAKWAATPGALLVLIYYVCMGPKCREMRYPPRPYDKRHARNLFFFMMASIHQARANHYFRGAYLHPTNSGGCAFLAQPEV